MKTGWFGNLFETAIVALSINIIIMRIVFDDIDRICLVVGLSILYGNWVRRIENNKEKS